MAETKSDPNDLLQKLAEGDFAALQEDAKRMRKIASRVNLQSEI
jgi:hypothetical protein